MNVEQQTALDNARRVLRVFAEFTQREDPEGLAAAVDNINGTLREAALVDLWLRRYVAALKLRRPM